MGSVTGRTRKRNSSGYTMAEFGPTLLIAFIIIVFPLAAVGTIGVRYVILVNAARLASQAAARCPQFKADLIQNIGGVNTTQLSAVDTALLVSKNSINKIGNNTVTWISTDTYIYVCPLGSTTMTTPGANVKLATNADPANNTYNCVVRVHASLQAMFPGFSGLLGSIPGLNAPLDGYAQTESVFESTSNLNQ